MSSDAGTPSSTAEATTKSSWLSPPTVLPGSYLDTLQRLVAFELDPLQADRGDLERFLSRRKTEGEVGGLGTAALDLHPDRRAGRPAPASPGARLPPHRPAPQRGLELALARPGPGGRLLPLHRQRWQGAAAGAAASGPPGLLAYAESARLARRPEQAVFPGRWADQPVDGKYIGEQLRQAAELAGIQLDLLGGADPHV
jgi:hypothetical protein